MPGYHLLERGTPLPTPSDPSGGPPQRIGFLDFLRELDGDEASVPRFWTVEVVGLEEVLFAAETETTTLALEIHRRLRPAAALLEAQLANVYLVFRGRLQRGDDLWCEFRGVRLPIGHIFGSPLPRMAADGSRTYFVNFNLTHGG